MNARSLSHRPAVRRTDASRLAALVLCAGLLCGCPPHKPTPIVSRFTTLEAEGRAGWSALLRMMPWPHHATAATAPSVIPP